jgi:hypothetical protein
MSKHATCTISMVWMASVAEEVQDSLQKTYLSNYLMVDPSDLDPEDESAGEMILPSLTMSRYRTCIRERRLRCKSRRR